MKEKVDTVDAWPQSLQTKQIQLRKAVNPYWYLRTQPLVLATCFHVSNTGHDSSDPSIPPPAPST